MPLTPSFGDKLIGPILALYGEAELRVFRWLAGFLVGERIAAGMTWLARKMMRLPKLRVGLAKIAKNLDAESAKRVDTALRSAWATGHSAARADVPTGAYPDEKTLVKLIDDVVEVIHGANRNIPIVGENVFRKVVQEAHRETDSDNQQKIIERALAKFARLGITGFVDKRGRRYDLTSYVEMAVRTAVTHAEIEGYTQQAAAAGYDLIVVSDVPGACVLCQPYEGAVLSISGATVGAIARDNRTGQAVRVDVLCSLDEARRNGLFHRACRHEIKVWTPDDPVPPRSAPRTESQRAASRRRALDRRLARQRGRIAAAKITARR